MKFLRTIKQWSLCLWSDASESGVQPHCSIDIISSEVFVCGQMHLKVE